MAPTPSSRPDGLPELLTQLAGEVAAPLTLALERLQQLLAAETPGNTALLALREPLRRARDASLMASQIGRLSSGRVIPSQEDTALHLTLRQVLEGRRREAQARGLQLRLDAVDCEVQSDPALLPGLLHALLDWALWHTRSSIDLRLGLGGWPAQARLSCRFATRDLDQPELGKPPALNDLRWLLVQHTASALGLDVQREDEAGVCVTQISFPLPRVELMGALETGPAPTAAQDTQPFAGWAAMVVSRDAGFHQRVAGLMEPLGWALDRWHSIDDAFQQALEALPQAIVVDGRLAGADLNQWRCHVLADAPGFCFIEVGDAKDDKAARSDGGLQCPLDDLEHALPALLRSALAPRGESLTFRL